MALKFSKDIVSEIAPARLFNAGCLDIHNVVPVILPQFFSSASVIEGDGGVGTVKIFHFNDGKFSMVYIWISYVLYYK
ncbi:putative START-like domain superfamily, Bet v I type allergen [Dioscorea sansibarensis]